MYPLPFGNLSLLDPTNPRNFCDPPWGGGGYGYLLELHIVMSLVGMISVAVVLHINLHNCSSEHSILRHCSDFVYMALGTHGHLQNVNRTSFVIAGLSKTSRWKEPNSL